MPGAGIEPTSRKGHDFKSCAYTSSATRATIKEQTSTHLSMKARAGIEPAYKGFAVPCLTTWLPCRSFIKYPLRQSFVYVFHHHLFSTQIRGVL